MKIVSSIISVLKWGTVGFLGGFGFGWVVNLTHFADQDCYMWVYPILFGVTFAVLIACYHIILSLLHH